MTNDNGGEGTGEGNSPHQINVTAQDLLAALGFEAQRLVAAVSQHAAGYPFPSPLEMQKVLDRMFNLNQTLTQFGSVLTQAEQVSFGAQSGMKVELN